MGKKNKKSVFKKLDTETLRELDAKKSLSPNKSTGNTSKESGNVSRSSKESRARVSDSHISSVSGKISETCDARSEVSSEHCEHLKNLGTSNFGGTSVSEVYNIQTNIEEQLQRCGVNEGSLMHDREPQLYDDPIQKRPENAHRKFKNDHHNLSRPDANTMKNDQFGSNRGQKTRSFYSNNRSQNKTDRNSHRSSNHQTNQSYYEENIGGNEKEVDGKNTNEGLLGEHQRVASDKSLTPDLTGSVTHESDLLEEISGPSQSQTDPVDEDWFDSNTEGKSEVAKAWIPEHNQTHRQSSKQKFNTEIQYDTSTGYNFNKDRHPGRNNDPDRDSKTITFHNNSRSQPRHDRNPHKSYQQMPPTNFKGRGYNNEKRETLSNQRMLPTNNKGRGYNNEKQEDVSNRQEKQSRGDQEVNTEHSLSAYVREFIPNERYIADNLTDEVTASVPSQSSHAGQGYVTEGNSEVPAHDQSHDRYSKQKHDTRFRHDGNTENNYNRDRYALRNKEHNFDSKTRSFHNNNRSENKYDSNSQGHAQQKRPRNYGGREYSNEKRETVNRYDKQCRSVPKVTYEDSSSDKITGSVPSASSHAHKERSGHCSSQAAENRWMNQSAQLFGGNSDRTESRSEVKSFQSQSQSYHVETDWSDLAENELGEKDPVAEVSWSDEVESDLQSQNQIDRFDTSTKSDPEESNSDYYVQKTTKSTPIVNWRERSSGSDNRSSYSGKSDSWNTSPKPRTDPRMERRSLETYDTSFEKKDDEYNLFEREERSGSKIVRNKLIEQEKDLFDMPKEYSFAHCVAEDMRMGSGIAVQFKREFKEVDTLLNQRPKQGGLALLEIKSDQATRYIYYLVTKRLSTGKPTYYTLWSSLQKMREHIKAHGVEKLAIPRIGCGLDRLEWSKVKNMIEFLFRDVNIEIVVCSLLQAEDDTPKKDLHTLKVVNVEKPVHEIESYTIILYFSTVDSYVTKSMTELDKKFNFLSKFKQTPRHMGDAIRHYDKNKNYILYGCIVRKTKDDLFDFISLRKCLMEINKSNRQDCYEYVGLDLLDDKEDLLNEKILTMLRFYLRKVDIYICSSWDGSLKG